MFILWRRARFLCLLLIIPLEAAIVFPQSFGQGPVNRNASAIPRTVDAAPLAVKKKIIASYRAALRKIPGDALLHNNLGVELAMTQEFASAAASLEKAVALDPSTASYLVNLGIVYANLGRNTEAWAVLDRAVALDPENQRAKIALCDQIAGGTDYRRTIACYTELRKHSELDPVSSYNLARALDSNGDPRGATRVLEYAAARYRNSPWIYNGLGMIRYKEKHYEEAAEAFKSAVEIDPARAELRFNLAIAQLAMRNRAGALSQYNLLKASNAKYALELYKLLFKDKVVFVGENR